MNWELIIIAGLLSYVIGIIFIPLLVKDILLGALSDKTSVFVLRLQYIPLVNVAAFIGLFIMVLIMLIWHVVKAVFLRKKDYDKLYPEIKYIKKK